MKLFMMPQTVPNRPTNGEIAPMVARIPLPRPIWRPAALTRRSKRKPVRSLMPPLSVDPADSSSSFCASRSIWLLMLLTSKLSACSAASSSVRTVSSAANSRRRARFPPPHFSTFTEQQSPGDNRSQQQANHHGFHHHVSVMVHPENREIFRDHRQRCRLFNRGSIGADRRDGRWGFVGAGYRLGGLRYSISCR